MSDDDGDDLYIDESASAPPARSTPTMSLTSMGMWANMGVKMTGKGRIAKKPGPKPLDATARKRPRGSTREMANLASPAELCAGKRSRRPATTTPRIIIEEEIAEAAQVAAEIAKEQEAAEDQAAAAAWARESIGTRDGDAAVLAAKKRQSMRASRRAASAVTNEARVETINRLSAISRELFDDEFGWDAKKLIVARTYWGMRKVMLQQHGLVHHGAIRISEEAAALAGGVSVDTARNWMVDFENKDGAFSRCFWGLNCKVIGHLADADHQIEAREWALANLGHRRGSRNKTALDFLVALHDIIGEDYDPEAPAISLSAATVYLHEICGAERQKVKTGRTFADNHGADYVQNCQRPAFLSLYQQIYDRGPNFIQGANGTFFDKDLVDSLYDSGLLNKVHAKP